jgi:hypothetical protein
MNTRRLAKYDKYGIIWIIDWLEDGEYGELRENPWVSTGFHENPGL